MAATAGVSPCHLVLEVEEELGRDACSVIVPGWDIVCTYCWWAVVEVILIVTAVAS
jgi:hypothetical protein